MILDKLFKNNTGKNLWIILISRVFSSIGYTMLMPFLAVILSKYHAMDMKTVAIVMAIYSFSQTGLTIPSAFIIDKLGYKKSMVLGRIVVGGGSLGYLYLNGITPLIIITLLIGLGSSVVTLASKGYISIETHGDSDSNLRFFTLLNISLNIGSSIGPLIGAFFIQGNNLGIVLYLVAGLNILSAIIVDTLVDNPLTVNRIGRGWTTFTNFGLMFKNKRFYVPFVITVLIQISFVQVFSVLPLYLEKVNVNLNYYSTILLVNTIMIIFAQMPILSFSERFIKGEKLIGLAFGAIFIAIGTVLFSFLSVGPWVLFLAIFIFTLGEIFFTPFADATISQIVDNPGHTNSYFSFFTFGWSVGKAIGNFVGISLLNHYQGGQFWFPISLFSWIAFAIAIIYFFSLKNKKIS